MRSVTQCGTLSICSSLVITFFRWALQQDLSIFDGMSSYELPELPVGASTAFRNITSAANLAAELQASVASFASHSQARANASDHSGKLFVVTEPPFEARNDGSVIVTDALQRAIDAAGIAGGGAEVLVPAGIYLTGALFLRSNIIFHLAAGARIQAVAPPKLWENCRKNKSGHFVTSHSCNRSRFDTWQHFPPVYVPDLQWDVGGFQHAAVLNGGRCRKVLEPAMAYGDRCQDWEKLHNVSIVGSGDSSIFDGAGHLWWKHCPKMISPAGAFTGYCPDDCIRDTQRPKLIHMLFTNNLVLRNFTAQNSAFWTVVPQYSTNVEIHSLRIRAPSSSSNTDGVDPQSCLNVTIQDLDISTGDDCIAVYAGSNLQGRVLGYPTKHVRISRVTCRKGHGMSVGSRTAGGISDVVFSNITCAGTDVCVRMKTCRGRGGFASNVSFLDVQLQGVKEAIRIDMQYEWHARTNSSATPRVNGVIVRNLSGTAKAPGEIRGLVEAKAEVQLENIQVATNGKLLCSEAKIKVRDMSMKVKDTKRCTILQ